MRRHGFFCDSLTFYSLAHKLDDNCKAFCGNEPCSFSALANEGGSVGRSVPGRNIKTKTKTETKTKSET